MLSATAIAGRWTRSRARRPLTHATKQPRRTDWDQFLRQQAPPMSRTSSAVDTTGVTGLPHDNLTQAGKRRLQARPYPLSKMLTSRVLQPGNVIQITMIELIEDGL